MNVYFATTVLGDRSRVAGARRIVRELQTLGYRVLTEHLFDDDAFEQDGRLSARAIFERDLEWLQSADVVVVEATGSSFGIGFETGFTLGALRVPLYLLYDAERAPQVSRMATGLSHPRARVIAYRSVDEAVARLRAELPSPGTP